MQDRIEAAKSDAELLRVAITYYDEKRDSTS
jgi:hypothetical protein